MDEEGRKKITGDWDRISEAKPRGTDRNKMTGVP